MWDPTGKKLYYLTSDGRAMMSAVANADGRGFEEPIKVFDLPENIHGGFVWWQGRRIKRPIDGAGNHDSNRR